MSYVLEAAVKDLQLLAGEAGLGLQLLQALGAVADGRQLQLILNAVWTEETSRRERKPRQPRKQRRGTAAAGTPSPPSRRGRMDPRRSFNGSLMSLALVRDAGVRAAPPYPGPVRRGGHSGPEG